MKKKDIRKSDSELSYAQKKALATESLKAQGYDEKAIKMIIKLAFGDDPNDVP